MSLATAHKGSLFAVILGLALGASSIAETCEDGAMNLSPTLEVEAVHHLYIGNGAAEGPVPGTDLVFKMNDVEVSARFTALEGEMWKVVVKETGESLTFHPRHRLIRILYVGEMNL
jgi:hypothetical protein